MSIKHASGSMCVLEEEAGQIVYQMASYSTNSNDAISEEQMASLKEDISTLIANTGEKIIQEVCSHFIVVSNQVTGIREDVNQL